MCSVGRVEIQIEIYFDLYFHIVLLRIILAFYTRQLVKVNDKDILLRILGLNQDQLRKMQLQGLRMRIENIPSTPPPPPRVPIRYRHKVRNSVETLAIYADSRVPTVQFLILPNFHSCFYNCMETRGKCFLFLNHKPRGRGGNSRALRVFPRTKKKHAINIAVHKLFNQ